LSIVIVLFYMVPTPHNVLDLAQEISRTERDGKDYVTMVLYNSNNLRTCEPEGKAVVTSTDCRRLAMLNVFLRESDLQQVPNKTHKICNICASKCSCGNCSSLLLENLFSSNKLEMVDIEESYSDCNRDIGSLRLLG
jgi:superfamily II DNA helicase RecQ